MLNVGRNVGRRDAEGPDIVPVWNWAPKTIPYMVFSPNSIMVLYLDPLGEKRVHAPHPGPPRPLNERRSLMLHYRAPHSWFNVHVLVMGFWKLWAIHVKKGPTGGRSQARVYAPHAKPYEP